MHWGYGILDVHPVSPISTFLHTFFTHFHHTYSFSRLIDTVIHFQGASTKGQWGNVSAPGVRRAGHLFGPVPHQWPFRGCTKGAHFAQCSYLGVWLY